MKIGFPNMGTVALTVKAFLDDVGTDYVLPPPTTRRTLELGTRWAPEDACLPLKLTTGTLLECHERGADTQLMLGAWGPCRFGYYCQMQRELLEDAGCAMEPLHLEVAAQGLGETLRRAKRLVGRTRPAAVARTARNTGRIAERLDGLERLTRWVVARQARPGQAEGLWQQGLRQGREVVGTQAMLAHLAAVEEGLRAVPLRPGAQPLRVGVVGEIYGTIDAWTNLGLEGRLGALGVEVERAVTISDWLDNYLVRKALHLPRDLRYAEAATPYVGADIGGHTRETVGHTLLHARAGFDGVIQIYPLGCGPEIVAQTILPGIAQETGMPVMTLVMDETTGEAGLQTRLEAFVDLLETRRSRREGGLA